MVMEPLNTRRDHPKLFLTRIGQAYQICRAVNGPSVKILYDMYHQQITEETSSRISIWDERSLTSRSATIRAGRSLRRAR